MSDLKEYLDLKKQYDKISEIRERLSKINLGVENESDLFRKLDEHCGWFLVRMQRMEKKANEQK